MTIKGLDKKEIETWPKWKQELLEKRKAYFKDRNPQDMLEGIYILLSVSEIERKEYFDRFNMFNVDASDEALEEEKNKWIKELRIAMYRKKMADNGNNAIRLRPVIAEMCSFPRLGKNTTNFQKALIKKLYEEKDFTFIDIGIAISKGEQYVSNVYKNIQKLKGIYNFDARDKNWQKINRAFGHDKETGGLKWEK